ncbi:hypothetical protein EYF80_021908 [Liparis tanakae]|uniref:Uncharacterized protein n=1 Tax=Liparis tanakae TaxID=230148 RepID=A0A4Z2HQ23_9TELE|nr:hypothetical protein EYF80_021908 [Liparis tanakae]
MNPGGHDGPRRPTLPPLSTRTLRHPSFMPLFMGADYRLADCSGQTLLPIIPAELFYTDPTMSCGQRVPNVVSELQIESCLLRGPDERTFNKFGLEARAKSLTREIETTGRGGGGGGVLDCFHLNTPTPVMSACPAPPTRPDPFGSGPHPTRDLGSLTLSVTPLHLPARPTQVVLQLTQEEDQAVTNLLQLHHQEEPSHWGSAEGGVAPLWNDGPCAKESRLQSRSQQGRCWSDTELEAANTLLRGFSPTEKDATASNR